jgi:hypothetical protein
MTNTKPCPCPNLNCPNHGVCEDCTSRHLKIGTLNYCGFYSILPSLNEAIESSPDSESAQMLSRLLQKQTKAYEMLMDHHDLTEEGQCELKDAASRFSKH